MIPMYSLWLHGLYGLYGPRCLLSEKAVKFNHSPTHWLVSRKYFAEWYKISWIKWLKGICCHQCYWNWIMTVFSLHISATLHLIIFGIWSDNIQSVQYVICVMIVRGLWYIWLAIRYKIWIVAHSCTSRGTFLRINGKTTLSPLDATAARRWRCSSCQS